MYIHIHITSKMPTLVSNKCTSMGEYERTYYAHIIYKYISFQSFISVLCKMCYETETHNQIKQLTVTELCDVVYLPISFCLGRKKFLNQVRADHRPVHLVS